MSEHGAILRFVFFRPVLICEQLLSTTASKGYQSIEPRLSLFIMPLDLPTIFLLPTHLDPEELHKLEDRIPRLTYDIQEADIVVGKVAKRERAMFELRRAKLETEPLDVGHSLRSRLTGAPWDEEESPATKRRRTTGPEASPSELQAETISDAGDTPTGIVKVVQLSWLAESLEQGVVLPMKGFLLYEGRKLPRNIGRQGTVTSKSAARSSGTDILRRAAEDQGPPLPRSSKPELAPGRGRSHDPPPLTPQTTAEHDDLLPPLPDFLHTTYSCQRPTPVDPPNEAFTKELKKVRTLRILQGDQIGIRAYSTSIATLAAYPHPLQSPQGDH